MQRLLSPRLPLQQGRDNPSKQFAASIFAEWNHPKANGQLHPPAAKSRAYGLAVAKIVAARKFSGAQPSQMKEWKQRARSGDTAEPWWQHLGSDEEFRRKIVQRMGPDFYRTVFQPAILQAREEGKRYEGIRDTLRTAWNRSWSEGS